MAIVRVKGRARECEVGIMVGQCTFLLGYLTCFALFYLLLQVNFSSRVNCKEKTSQDRVWDYMRNSREIIGPESLLCHQQCHLEQVN